MPNINFLDESEMTAMPTDDRRRLDSHESSIESMEKQIKAIDTKLDAFIKSMSETLRRMDSLYYAFAGNELDDKSGMRNRIIDLEKGCEAMKERVKKLEDERARVIAYASAISVVLSSAVTALTLYGILK